MTNQQEAEYIHTLLQEVLEHPDGIVRLDHTRSSLGFSEQEGRELKESMENKALIVSGKYYSHVTSHGRDIAREPGGYLGMLEAQRQEHLRQRENEQEDRNLARISALSTQDAAESSRISATWSKISGRAAIVAVGVSIIALILSVMQQANSTATDIQVEALQQQVQELKQQLKQPTTNAGNAQLAPRSPASTAPK